MRLAYPWGWLLLPVLLLWRSPTTPTAAGLGDGRAGWLSVCLAGDEFLALLNYPRVVAVSSLASSQEMSHVASHYPPSLPRVSAQAEDVISHQPQAVFAADYTRPEVIQLWRQAGLEVFVFSAYRDFDQLATTLTHLGERTQRQAEAQAYRRKMDNLRSLIRRKVQGRNRPRVLHLEPPNFSNGSQTLIDQLIREAGGHNLANDLGLVGPTTLSPEIILALQPEVIITSSAQGLAQSLPSAVWHQLPAVKQQRVYQFSSRQLLTVSPFIIDSLEPLARRLHPQAFGESEAPQ